MHEVNIIFIFEILILKCLDPFLLINLFTTYEYLFILIYLYRLMNEICTLKKNINLFINFEITH